jgi:hypothetical protein
MDKYLDLLRMYGWENGLKHYIQVADLCEEFNQNLFLRYKEGNLRTILEFEGFSGERVSDIVLMVGDILIDLEDKIELKSMFSDNKHVSK